MVELRLSSPAEVRAAVAWHMLGERVPAVLGDVTLHAHQVTAIHRLGRMLVEHRGALLADDVGLGKSYVALALARSARSAVIVAPAATRMAWGAACQRAQVSVPFISIESLARRSPPGEVQLVIVDEAHHLRNPRTQRFVSAAKLCQHCMVLLLTATPVQNALDDLRTLLSLFLGARAFALSPDDLGRYCLKRDARDIAALIPLPTVLEPAWLPEVADSACLERIIALPPPLPPLDGSDGGILLSYTLVRQWSSSRAALRGALRRRLATAAALQDSLRAGRHPTRRELRAWIGGDDALQLAFPELVASMEIAEPAMLLAQSQRHTVAIRELCEWLLDVPDPDLQRADIVAGLMRRHAGERVILFSEYADTVARLYRLLAVRVRCAMLTHRGGRVVGGAISRRELLARFDPHASSPVHESDRIDLLLTTDVFSEGVNLHAASVVIHADLAWNPARLQQRVGRLRRIGALRDTVHVYLFSPPAEAHRLLGIEPLLRRKLAVAAASIGTADGILPGAAARRVSPLAHGTRITEVLSTWHGPDVASEPVASTIHGASLTELSALACVRLLGTVELLAVRPSTGSVSTDPQEVAELARVASSGAPATTHDEVTAVLDLVERYCRGRTLAAIVAPPSIHAVRSRRETLRRIDGFSRQAGRSAQATQLALVSRARDAAACVLPAGAEMALAALARDGMPDDTWLRSVSDLAAEHSGNTDEPEILAVLVVRP